MPSMDLTRTLTQRIGFNYVLIIEWLDPYEQRTGALLSQHLKNAGVSCRLAICNSADVVRQCLQEVLRRIPEWGVPAVHVETHGEEPSDDLEADVVFGVGDGPFLSWSELGELLAPINAASGFQLLLVGAACHGAAAMGTMNPNSHVAPYAVCLGFNTEVIDDSVLSSMSQIYTSLLVEGHEIRKAVELAEAAMRPGESIDWRTSVMVAYGVLRWTREKLLSPGASTPELLRQTLEPRMKEVWNKWFPEDLQRRDETYVLDWQLVEASHPTDGEPTAQGLAQLEKGSLGTRIRAAILRG